MGPFYELHISGGDMTADITPTKAISTRMMPALCVKIDWTGGGAPQGDVIAQVALELEEPASDSSSWVALDTSAYQEAAGGADGAALWTISDVAFNWFRVIYDYTSGGTGETLDVKVSGKVFGG